MMDRRVIFYLFCLALPAWLLLACSAESTPEPDRVATRVAEERAVAATLTAEALASLPTAAASPAAPATATVPPPATPAGAAQPTATPVPVARCTVVANGLNLRPGPGTVFQPPLAALPAGAELSPIAFTPTGFPDGQWLEVQAGGQTGWVSAGSQFVSCNIDPATLPAPAAIPPTPTPAPTNTPVPAPPSPTPTRPLFAVVPVDGDDGNTNLRGSQPGNEGRNIIIPGIPPGSVGDPVVFGDRIVFRIEVFDSARGGQRDGDGIQNVEFNILQDGDPVYERTEQTPAYCVFGGGEPDCEVWDFSRNNFRWPNGQPAQSGPHRAEIVIRPQYGGSAQWNWNFNIELSQELPPAYSNLVAEIVQIGPGSTADVVSDALVFQVVAYNEAEGNQDGDGIANVDMRILDQYGDVVYQRRENNAAYCAFSGGEPDCNVLVFADYDYRWPDNGPEITSGPYILQAIVHGQDGSSATVETEIEIQ